MNPLVMAILQGALGGIGIFLLGMRLLSDGLQAIAGERLNKLISSVTDNRLLAILVGIGVTCVIQSSTATTVMVVGFVNSGIMTLMQGIGVVFGANIGTTLSLWILTLDISKYGGLIIGVAVFFYLFSKKEKVRFVGMSAMGLGMLFFGLKLLSDGFAPLRGMPEVRDALSFFQATNALRFLAAAIVGGIVTALIHSSAAVVLLVMGLAGASVVDFPTAVALVLGSNIGTTVTALIACIGATRNALRAALAHTLFNLIGVVGITFFWRPFSSACQSFADWAFSAPVGAARDAADPAAQAAYWTAYYTFAIACVHTFFNVTATAVLCPFMKTFARVVTWMVPVRESEKAQEGYKARYLDLHLIPQTAVALGQAQKEILLMGETCDEMLASLRGILESGKEDEEASAGIFKKEENLDFAQMEISEYVGKVLRSNVSRDLSHVARRLLRQADEYESVSDYVRNALKSYRKIRAAEEDLTDAARAEVLDLTDRVATFNREVMDIVTIGDRFNVKLALERFDEVEKAAKGARAAHMERLGVTCTSPVKSLIYSDLLVAFRRMNDHLLNIAQTLEV